MKKYLLVSLTIFFTAAFVLAQDAATVEPTVDIEADATVSWGVDLGKGGVSNSAKHGFNNEASWTVKFPLLKKANKTSAKSDVPVYGEVVLKDVALNIQSSDGKDSGKFGVEGKVGGIAAKFVFYGVYIVAYDKPDFTSNYANIWDPLLTNKRKSSYKFAPGFEGYGFKFGYANKDFLDLDVGVKFGSNGNWDSAVSAGTTKNNYVVKYFDGNTKLGGGEHILMDINGNPTWVDKDSPIWGGSAYPKKGTYAYYKTVSPKDNHSEYAVGFDLSMKPLDKMLGLAFTVNSTLVRSDKYNEGVEGEENDKVALSIGAEVTSEPVDGLKLKFGFDGGSDFDTGNKNRTTDKAILAFAWDMLFDAQYKWIGAGVYVSSPGTKFAGTNYEEVYRNPDGTPKFYGKFTDVSFYAKLETSGDKKKASNLVEGLDAGVYLAFHQLRSAATAAPKRAAPLVGKVWGAYKASISDSIWIKPYADLWFNTNHPYGTDKDLKLKVGLVYDLGLTFSPAEKVEFDAKWTHGTLEKNNFASVVDASAIENQHKGKFVLSLKLTY